VHAFEVSFLERASQSKTALPLHVARKKVPYVDEAGVKIEPTEPNAIKFERFIFDLLPQAENALVVEVERAEAFAPVKNAPGSASDTPASAQAAMVALHRSWLEAAGAKVAPDSKVEIHPAVALDAESLRQRIAPGTQFNTDMYLQ
jgi:UDP-N-acetylglucosamine/UDP-N-acetylgalactosamine diphosphorylase